MDGKQKVYTKAAVVVAGLLILWWLLNRLGSGNKNIVAPDGSYALNGFQAPYLTTNPGIPDNWNFNTGGNPFNSVNNINVNTGFINGLSNTYMPMFGLVGMTAVSG